MSKLAIVLCASIFLATTLVECRETLDGEELQQVVHTASNIIEDRIQQIRHNVYALGTQPSPINFEIIEELRENVTNHMDVVHNLVQWNLGLQKKENNDSECMRHYDNYKALAASVETNLNNSVSSVALSTLESFGKTIAAATEFVGILKKIEVWAPQCKGLLCNFVNSIVTSEKNNLLQSLEEAFDDYKKLADGSSVREAVRTDTDYYHFIKSEDDFWNDFLECLTETPSSTSAA